MTVSKSSSPQGLYPIGDAAKIANISRKALRFYHSVGLLEPDKILENEHRYYSKDNLLVVPVIKYYKQMGFQIDEMRDLINGTTYSTISGIFLDKLNERMDELAHIQHQCTSIKDWSAMIVEALRVIERNLTEVNVRFVDPTNVLVLEQDYKPDYRDAIINIEFTNFIESIENKITGPVIRYFDSISEFRAGTLETQTMLQKPIKTCARGECIQQFGGDLMISCYHIGSHNTIQETYDRMLSWVEQNNYETQGGVYERYLADYWLTNDESQFVTEILMEITK